MTPEERMSRINRTAEMSGRKTHLLCKYIMPSARAKFMNTLHDIIARKPETPRNKVGAALVTDFDKVSADPADIAEAVLVTLGEIEAVKKGGKL
jgi:hypothetical protein